MSIDISSISPNQQPIGDLNKISNGEKKNTIFEQFYNSAIGLLEQTNNMQVNSDKFQLEFAAGKTDDMAGLVLAQEKAYTALQFTSQITNKVLESYRQILQIQL
jgi:flagellar hook-basal body complex protein FliE